MELHTSISPIVMAILGVWAVVAYFMIRHYNRRAERARQEAERMTDLVEVKGAEILDKMSDDEPSN